MAAPKTKKKASKKNGDKMVTPAKSLHIVHYACGNCSGECEDLKLCSGCKAPMKVIQVTEKFGEDAENYLKELKKNSGKNKVIKTKSPLKGDGAISEEGLEKLEDNVPEEREIEIIGDIYPDERSGGVKKSKAKDNDFSKALSKLDEEDSIDDFDGFGTEGVIPEL